MARLVKKHELSKKSGIVATSRTPFKDDEVKRLTKNLTRFSLVYDADFFYIYGE